MHETFRNFYLHNEILWFSRISRANARNHMVSLRVLYAHRS